MKTGKPYAAALAEALAGCAHFFQRFHRSTQQHSRYRIPAGLTPIRPKHGFASCHADRERLSFFRPDRRNFQCHSDSAPAYCGLEFSPLPQLLHSRLPPKSFLPRLIAEGRAPTDPNRIDSYLLAKLRFMSLNELQTLPECTEGLENRLVRTAQQSGTLSCLLKNLKTRRYPYSRLQRLLAHVLLGTTKNLLADFDQSGPLYARVLAANRQGRSALRTITRNSAIPVITKTAAFLNSQKLRSQSLSPLQTMLMFDIRATDIFSLCLPAPAARIGGLDFLTSATFANNF